MADRKRGRQPDSSSRVGDVATRERCMADRDNDRSRQHRDVPGRGADVSLEQLARLPNEPARLRLAGGSRFPAPGVRSSLGSIRHLAHTRCWDRLGRGRPAVGRNRGARSAPHAGFLVRLRSGHSRRAGRAAHRRRPQSRPGAAPGQCAPGLSGAWSIVTAVASLGHVAVGLAAASVHVGWSPEAPGWRSAVARRHRPRRRGDAPSGLRPPVDAVRRPRLARDVLHHRHGALADEPDGHRVGAHNRLTVTPMKGER